MGLIKAAIGSAGGVLADQWREYFYCDSLPDDILVRKGVKRTGKRSSNTKGSDNIITNGSVIAVNEGQAMMIVNQGGIVEFTAEVGQFTWDAGTQGSIFYGGLGQGLKASWEEFKSRFTFGGEPGGDQRVYFFNLKEIIGNKYGTPTPIPFRVVDPNIGLDTSVSIRCNGEYSYKISDPILFYKKICGNVTQDYDRKQLDSQLKSEFLTALQPAFARISEMGIRYSALPGHTLELSEAMNDVLSAKWSKLRGISIVSVGINSVTASAEDEAALKELQRFHRPDLAAAHLVGAQAQAMKDAANNAGGAMTGFLGMNMAQATGGFHADDLYKMAQQQSAPQQRPVPESKAPDGWKCGCGTVNTGKFCTECGATRPAAGWTCTCGAVNKGKFCSECGAKKPAAAPLYRCDKCGWEPEDPKNPPKFCPECGDRFTDDDII